MDDADSVLRRASEIYAEFDPATRKQLNRFVADTRHLATFRFFEQVPRTLTISIPARGEPLTGEMEEPDDEAVRAVITIFRQLYTRTEPTSFVRAMKTLKRSVRARASQFTQQAIAEIDDIRRGQAEILDQGAFMAVVVNGREVSVKEILDSYLHGHYLHAMNDKSDLVEVLDAMPPIARMTLYSVMLQLTKLYWVGANVAELALETQSDAR